MARIARIAQSVLGEINRAFQQNTIPSLNRCRYAAHHPLTLGSRHDGPQFLLGELRCVGVSDHKLSWWWDELVNDRSITESY